MTEIIIKEIPRDLPSLNQIISVSMQHSGTTVPSTISLHCNDSKFKQKLVIVSLIASSVANATPSLGEVKFTSQSNSSALDIYLDKVEKPFDSALEEYKYLFRYNTTIQMLLHEVMSFKSLNNNWDGYGAIPTEAKSASNVINLANRISERQLSRLTDVFPNPNGTVTMEWENHSGERLVLEMGNETFSYYVKLNSLEPIFKDNLQIADKFVYELSKNIKRLFI
jgi:hypothetical protein